MRTLIFCSSDCVNDQCIVNTNFIEEEEDIRLPLDIHDLSKECGMYQPYVGEDSVKE